MKPENIASHLVELRPKFEQSWNEATASPKLQPVSGKPLSTGQCSATSLVLADLLREFIAPNQTIRFAVGAVHNMSSQDALIPLHVWILLYDDPYDEPLVIDITADQSPEISEQILVAAPTQLMKRGLLYLPHSIMDVLKPQTHQRALLLHERLKDKK